MVRKLSHGAHQSIVGRSCGYQASHLAGARIRSMIATAWEAAKVAPRRLLRKIRAAACLPAGRASRREPVAEVGYAAWVPAGETRTRVEEESSIRPDSWRCGAAPGL